MNNTRSPEFPRTVPEIYTALGNIHATIDQIGIEKNLHHLLLLRASQINQCGYCVDRHTREARSDGESNERLDNVIVFKQVNCFSKKEKLALEWAEALTYLSPQTDYSGLRSNLLEFFSLEEIAALTALIGMINLWNRIQISEH